MNVLIHKILYRSLYFEEVEEDITLLLGKNESRKTNFLQALEWFSTTNPLEEDDRCSYENKEEEVKVTLSFKFDNKSKELFRDYFGVVPKEPDIFQVT